MNPHKEVFVKHKQLFDLLINDGYIPQGSNNMVGEIYNAYHSLTGAKVDFNCSGCVVAMLKTCNTYRLAYMAELEAQPKEEPTQMNFPKVDPIEEPKKDKWYNVKK